MKEQKYIRRCLLKIEKKLRWGTAEHWPNSKFIELSSHIGKKTGITISSSSLKRLYGRAKTYKKDSRPQIETKNALAIFLDYRNWDDFVRKQHPLYFVKGKKMSLLFLVALVAIFILIFYLPKTFTKKESRTHSEFTFKGKNLNGTHVPHTVIIHYDISKLPYDTAYVDFGEDPKRTGMPNENHSYQALSKEKHTITYTYFVKRYYRIRLLNNQKNEIAGLNVMLKTNQWEGTIEQENQLLHIQQKALLTSNGTMLYPPDKMKKKGLEPQKEFRVYYRNIKDFDINADNMTIETKIRAFFDSNMIDCDHFQLALLGQNRRLFLTFMEKGCAGGIHLQFGDKIIKGEEHDLTGFTDNLGKWTTIKLINQNKNITVIKNNTTIYSGAYQQNIDSLKGIRYEFKGAGEIDYIRINNSSSGIVSYNKDF